MILLFLGCSQVRLKEEFYHIPFEISTYLFETESEMQRACETIVTSRYGYVPIAVSLESEAKDAVIGTYQVSLLRVVDALLHHDISYEYVNILSLAGPL
jgi:hypothetical protein